MHLNLKALGLALVAVFAMSAMAASGASAQTAGQLTADEPVTLVGHEDGLNALTTSVGVRACPGSTITGHKTVTALETSEGTKHSLLKAGESTITLTPHYVNCLTITPDEAEHKTTVTINGCDYELEVGETVLGGYAVAMALVCPLEESIEVDVYPFKGSELGGVACTTVIPAQGGLTGPVLSNNGAHLTLSGTFGGTESSRSGFGCETSESETDELHVSYTFTGLNAAGTPINVALSH